MATELLFTVKGQVPQPAQAIHLAAAGLKERRDVEEWIIAHQEIIGPDVMIVTSEFAGWASKAGTKDADRLDVLGLAKDGRLVVVELKRGDAPSTVGMQVLNYAARASLFTTEQLASVHRQFRNKRGHADTLDQARARLEDWAQDLSDDTLGDTPRLVLVAEGFGLDVTTTAIFLARQFQVEIELIRLAAYRTASDEMVISLSRTFPPPDMDELLLFPNVEQRQEKKLQRTKEKNTVMRLLAAEAIADGTELRFKPGGEVAKADREAMLAWVAEDAKRGLATWQSVSSAPLVWAYDGKPYSPTGLVKHIGSMAGIEVGATQGPRSWRDAKGRTLPQIAERAEGGSA